MRNINEYTKDWKYISREYIKSVGNKCEDCGRPNTKKRVIATDHKDGNKKNNVRSNFRARCPSCHFKKGVESGEIPKYILNKVKSGKWRQPFK